VRLIRGSRIFNKSFTGLRKTAQTNSAAVVRHNRQHFGYDFEEVIASRLNMDVTRHMDRFIRYQIFLKSRIPWKKLSFEDASVLELDCGPTLGWASIAIYFGCNRYIRVEPVLKGNFIHKEDLANRYILPLFRQLEGHFQKGRFIEDCRKRLSDRVAIYITPF
jgi:hypothetical protein